MYSHILKSSCIKNKHPTHEGTKNRYKKRITRSEDSSTQRGIVIFVARRVKKNNNIPTTEEGIGIFPK
ncbi:hypothetical protein N9A09_00675 [Porticoccus sp.]|jgi:hypothetical protein|nr:hypothetical protein [Porticoccus sp.]